MSYGKRYSATERKEILNYLNEHTYEETMEKFGVSQMSLARWIKNKKKRDTNTIPPLLENEVQKELQVYLGLIENSKIVRAAAIVTAAGELILPESMGFQSIFSNVHDITSSVSNFLLCAKGFTSAVVNEQKQGSPVFDDLSIKTPMGIFLISSVKRAVLVTLFSPELNLHDAISHDANFISKIKEYIIMKCK